MSRPAALRALVGAALSLLPAACSKAGQGAGSRTPGPQPPVASSSAPHEPGPTQGSSSLPVPTSLPLPPAWSDPGRCNRAYDHIETLTVVGLAPSAAAARRRDLEVNRPSFDRSCRESKDDATLECLQVARTLDDAAQCGAGTHGASTRPAEPEAHAGQGQCEAAFDHLEELVLAELPKNTPSQVRARARAGVEDKRRDVVGACLSDGTPAVVDCILRAKVISDTDLCGGS